MVKEKLKEAAEWLQKALKLEEEKKSTTMIKKAIQKAVELEAQGIAAGESW